MPFAPSPAPALSLKRTAAVQDKSAEEAETTEKMERRPTPPDSLSSRFFRDRTSRPWWVESSVVSHSPRRT